MKTVKFKTSECARNDKTFFISILTDETIYQTKINNCAATIVHK